jgi:hypothetical protein
MKRLVSAAAAVGLGLAALVVPGTGPASAADPSTVTDIQIDRRVVVVYPDKRVQDTIPTMRFTINLPSPTARIDNIDVLGFSKLGPGSSSIMTFNPVCGVTATCTRVGSAETVVMKLKLVGYPGTNFSSDSWVPFEFPGTYTWQFNVYGDFGDFFYPTLAAAAKTVGPGVTFKRATKVSLTAPSSVPKGSKVRLAGVAKVVRTCTTYNRSVCDYGDIKWFVLPRRSLALVFDPAGTALPRTRKTVVTDAKGRFAARLTQRVPGTWYAVLPATAKAAGDASPRRLVRIR